jgi:hypothetical protein
LHDSYERSAFLRRAVLNGSDKTFDALAAERLPATA